MNIQWNTELYCLIGNPVEKSLSPIIHNTIYKSLGLNYIYLTFNIQKMDLETTIKGLKALNVKGFNVTIPYKKEIIKYLDKLDYTAEIIGAVNTVKNENGKLIGYNSDGLGFIQSFQDNSINLKNKNILLLGSGGAAYAIGSSLANEDIKSIGFANRTINNVIHLKNKIKKINNNIDTDIYDLSLKGLNKKNIDIIINATSVGMYPLEDFAPIELNGFSENTIVYDIIYKPENTKLINDAKELRFTTINGMTMLINQAVISQNIWLNLKGEINLKIFKEIKGILGIM